MEPEQHSGGAGSAQKPNCLPEAPLRAAAGMKSTGNF